MKGRWWTPVACAGIALLAGCDRKSASPPPETRPDWSRFTIDGLAPLMSPDTVERVLAERGYKAVPCVPGEPIPPDALRTSDDPSICYEDRTRNWRVVMYFMDLIEGRRLAVISFKDADFVKVDEDVLRARNAAFWPKLVARFGEPDHLHKLTYTFRVWVVPGSKPSLPDNIKTVDAPFEGRFVEMTSFWAYRQQQRRVEAGAGATGTP